MAHAVLSGIDVRHEAEGAEDSDGLGETDGGRIRADSSVNRYVAVLEGPETPGRERDLVWRRFDSNRVIITRSFVVMDTGMQVKAGTVCDVIAGDFDGGGQREGAGDDGDGGGLEARPSSHIYVRFSHPEPPWAVLVGRLDGMATELEVRHA